MTDDGFGATRDLLDAEVAEGLFTLGAQVAVRVDGEEVLSYAAGDDGLGRPMRTDSLLRVYCTIKPVTAIAVARQVDAGTLDLDAPLADLVPGWTALDDGTVTLRHVLDHTAGLHRPSAVDIELRPPDQREAAARGAPRPPGWRVGRDAAYSEWPAWTVLAAAVERVTGRPIGDHLREAVLEPLGLHDTFIGMTKEEHAANAERLGVGLDLRGDDPVPLLMERTLRVCTEVNPAYGGYSTGADLARFYAAVLDARTVDRRPELPSPATTTAFTSTNRPATNDAVLGRPCAYGLGFMTELAGHAFGHRPSPEAFGHSGNVGSSFAFADPAVGLAVGVVLNGIVDPESAFVRRPALVQAIYDDVAATFGTGADQAAGGDASGGPGADLEPRRRRGLLRRRPRG